MADKDQMTWRAEATHARVFEVDSATVINRGDFVFQDTDDVKPASDQVDQVGGDANRELFHDNFAGIAAQRSRAGDTNPIRVNTRGIHEYDCDAAQFEQGDLVGMKEEAGGTFLEDQVVVAVATENLAVGRVAKRYGSNTTKVLVDIFSTVVVGGAQAPA